MNFTAGERVTRKSHNHDLLFRIAAISGDTAILHGEDMRLAADAPLDDLVRIGKRDLKILKQKIKEQEASSYRLFRQDYQLMKDKREYQSGDGYQHTAGFFQLPAKVLHVDGDRTYLRKCTELYNRVGLEVHGVYVDEKEMMHKVSSLLDDFQTDFFVFMGYVSYYGTNGQ